MAVVFAYFAVVAQQRVYMLQYIADRFGLLSELHICLQGLSSSTVELYAKVKPLQMKLFFAFHSSVQGRHSCFCFSVCAEERNCFTSKLKLVISKKNSSAQFESTIINIFSGYDKRTVSFGQVATHISS
jgi:hypothetical protein